MVIVPLTIPSSIVTLAGGTIFSLAYGKSKGYFICMAAIWLGHPPAAIFAYFMGRLCLRSFIRKHLITKLRIFEAIDKSIEVEGYKLMILLRVQPIIPWNHLNYILAVTSCSLPGFIIGFYIGMTPGTMTMLYVLLE